MKRAAALATLIACLSAAAAADAARPVRLATPGAADAQARSVSSIRVLWRDRAHRETRYEVLRPGRRTVTLRKNATTFLDRGLTPATTHRYLVRACRRTRCGRAARVRATTRQTYRPGAGTQLAGCPLLPADHAFNRDVSRDPVDPDSAAYIESIGLSGRLHPDFGSGRLGDFGIPFAVVPPDQPPVPVRFTAFADESDPGPYPIPAAARVEAGGDRHVLVLRQGECKLYELFDARREGRGWEAASGAVFDLRSGRPRPAGWTSADAAGLPILPGLARAGEVASGRITHALRMTVSRTQRAYVAPARHFASTSRDPQLPPMGLRLRLRADYDLSRFRGQSRVILEALKTYGLIVADNGSDWFISGAPDPAWDDEDLEQLKTVPGRAFEVVRTGRIVRG